MKSPQPDEDTELVLGTAVLFALIVWLAVIFL